MKINKCNNKDECYIKIVDLIILKINELVTKQKNIILGIPGGRNVSMIFHELMKHNINWNKVHIFMVDERQVPLESVDSNYKLAYDNFLKKLINDNKISKRNIHPFKVEEGVEKYNEELKQYGGVYDIILLSSGEDGHVAALFPYHHSIKNENSGYISMNDSPKMPSHRMSMSKNQILNSRNAILMFIGNSKRNAYMKFNDYDLNHVDVPAKLVLNCEKYYIFTDLK